MSSVGLEGLLVRPLIFQLGDLPLMHAALGLRILIFSFSTRTSNHYKSPISVQWMVRNADLEAGVFHYMHIFLFLASLLFVQEGSSLKSKLYTVLGASKNNSCACSQSWEGCSLGSLWHGTAAWRVVESRDCGRCCEDMPEHRKWLFQVSITRGHQVQREGAPPGVYHRAIEYRGGVLCGSTAFALKGRLLLRGHLGAQADSFFLWSTHSMVHRNCPAAASKDWSTGHSKEAVHKVSMGTNHLVCDSSRACQNAKEAPRTSSLR
eukprot:1161240-Pelagomonas_calceolata.AAC.7